MAAPAFLAPSLPSSFTFLRALAPCARSRRRPLILRRRGSPCSLLAAPRMAVVPPPLNAPPPPTPLTSPLPSPPPVNDDVLPQRVYSTWQWRGYSINYRAPDEGTPPDAPPVLLIHGFGASVFHWAKNIPALAAAGSAVYAVDLLGFGASVKATEAPYSIELWAELVTDFMAAHGGGRKWALVGNSIGSLVALTAADAAGPSAISGLALLNCAGGMTSFRPSEMGALPRAGLWFFSNVVLGEFWGPRFFARFRTRKNIRSALEQVYVNKTQVTDALVEGLYAPSLDDGACAVFLSILTGDAGPTPRALLGRLGWADVLVLWGREDPWTPLGGGASPGIRFEEWHGAEVTEVGGRSGTFRLTVLDGVGHCPHDDAPEQVNEALVPFLQGLPYSDERAAST
ncbi:hypothetical protein I4F81_001493 [Pyropia yezoensis]|uniref:Uncharacterized protein n=1 Tax=Pyropia yezoensis TaxID=2788 RepID=A0ACC3BLV4_PYRYE|nr:hypothetical protein I4F81_001493 [Neopyropia yezoensis]